MSDTWSDIERYYQSQLKTIANRCKEILEDAIQSEVYDKYIPTQYVRSYQLLNNVRVDVRDGIIYTYVNTGNMDYTSNKPNSEYPSSQWVPYWIEHGHNTSSGGVFMYDNYPSRDFIRVAKERIEHEFGLEVNILDEGID